MIMSRRSNKKRSRCGRGGAQKHQKEERSHWSLFIPLYKYISISDSHLSIATGIDLQPPASRRDGRHQYTVLMNVMAYGLDM